MSMNFKDLKPDYIIYVLDKQNLTCDEAKVVSVGMPRFENKLGTQPCTVVDVTLEHNGKNVTYVFPDGSSNAYSGNYTFCIDKNAAVADIKTILRSSEQIIADMPKHKEKVEKCNLLLADLDVEEKAKQEMESRLSKMESRFDNIETLLRQIASK